MKVTFEFPDDAWQGIMDAFAGSYNRPEKINDPSGKRDKDGGPLLIDNPESKEAFTSRKVQEYVADIWGSWAKQQNLKDVAAKVEAAISARKVEVAEATKVTVEATMAPTRTEVMKV